jgi:hypothetical protein
VRATAKGRAKETAKALPPVQVRAMAMAMATEKVQVTETVKRQCPSCHRVPQLPVLVLMSARVWAQARAPQSQRSQAPLPGMVRVQRLGRVIARAPQQGLPRRRALALAM